MVLDPATILVIHLLIILLVSVSYFVSWLDGRNQDALLWMFGGTMAAGIGIVCRFVLPSPLSLILSNGLIAAAGLCLVFACRRLRDAPIWPVLLPVPALLWCGVVALPYFAGIGPRLVLANAILGLLFLVAAREVWLATRDNLVLRLYVAGLLVIQSAVYFVWSGYNLAAPPAPQSHLLTLRGLILTDLVTLVMTLLLAIGLIGLVREHSLRVYRDAALLDAVTGVQNRRAFDEKLSWQMADCARRGRTLAAIMIDADHFKSYNDRYGHLQGDACLRRIAQALKTALMAAGGTLYRYGGEEFVGLVALPDARGIAVLAERLRQAVSDLALAHEAQAGGIVTISLGVAVAEPSSCTEAGTLLAAADDALYQAKRGGRDRVIILGAVQAAASSGGQSIIPHPG